ncbi:SgrR family transcriptional regulator [Pantoea coffeiphila]|uniref:SgrR family transcriptional regulator n=1 Tax=Pantoea coffeiphila TaxID=1465635 RepID=UPI00195F3C71|nr:SgrR family transcriptional regulator [Pantoea coffeiphila]MBM7342824.1 MarR-like DNA-binding transcriptional regulator SgrR of sgrS sRNA [Pantoea coffeiphila]
MREINRLNQYQRLWQRSEGQPLSSSVSEIANCCFCSERHVRTLLNQWQEAGWLGWEARSGRGKRGTVTFLRSPEALRSEMMLQQLDRGQPQHALQLVPLATEQLSQLLQPFLGGQWQNNQPTLRIPYYRKLDPLRPLVLAGRAEQHLAQQVFSGLSRLAGDDAIPDLAHHWQISDDGLSWFFFLRPQLRWHHGEAVTAQQLQQTLQNILASPTGERMLASVKRVSQAHALCLRIDLHQADYWLAHRLASVCCLLPHPDNPDIGTGPWRLVANSTMLVRLESHGWYHGVHPLMQAVEYWIAPQLFDRELGTSCRHPVQIAIGAQQDLAQLQPVSQRISLGFCYLAIGQRAGLNAAQAQHIMALVHQSGLVEQLPLEEGLISPSNEMLPGWHIPQWKPDRQTALPATLSLHYHLPVELHAMAIRLQQLLAAQGCRLTLHFHPAKNWQDYPSLAEADLVMGDRLIGEAPVFTLESWLRLDPLWPVIIGKAEWQKLLKSLNELQQHADGAGRNDAMHDVFKKLMHQAAITPLFNYRYQVSAPPDVEGIRLNAWGWFDFSRAWLPPPVAID